MALKTNYKDDGFTGNRKYRQITNPDNSVSFEDITVYNPVGDSFGAKDINDTNIAINGIVNPTFEDYTGSTTVPDPETALAAIKSKAGITALFSNIKAVLKGVFFKKYMLTTKEQIMANTLAGRTADALVVKEINSDLGGYQFDIIDGVPSYKAGADAAWVPFKRKPIIEKASFSWAYSPSQTFPQKDGYEIIGLYADITGINSNSAVNINFGISKNLAAGRISISGQTYVNIMGAFYCIYV